VGMLAELGYKGFAVERRVHASMLLKDHAGSWGAGKGNSGGVCGTGGARLDRSYEERVQQGLLRLTVTLDTAEQLDLLRYSSLEGTGGYDVVAVHPTSQEALDAACKHQSVDLVSLDLGGRLPFTIKPAAAGLVHARGAFFEVRYADALRSSACAQYFFCNAAALLRACRRRGIIMSSGAQSAGELRAPHDAASLLHLAGCKSLELALKFCRENCQKVVERTRLRQLRRQAIRVGPSRADEAAAVGLTKGS